jgi:hypothetical protein
MSLNTRSVLIDPFLYRIRGRGSYEKRLAKYGLRGFAIVDPHGHKYKVKFFFLSFYKSKIENFWTRKIEFENGWIGFEWNFVTISCVVLVLCRFAVDRRSYWLFTFWVWNFPWKSIIVNSDLRFKQTQTLKDIREYLEKYSKVHASRIYEYGKPTKVVYSSHAKIISKTKIDEFLTPFQPDSIENNSHIEDFYENVFSFDISKWSQVIQ